MHRFRELSCDKIKNIRFAMPYGFRRCQKWFPRPVVSLPRPGRRHGDRGRCTVCPAPATAIPRLRPGASTRACTRAPRRGATFSRATIGEIAGDNYVANLCRKTGAYEQSDERNIRQGAEARPSALVSAWCERGSFEQRCVSRHRLPASGVRAFPCAAKRAPPPRRVCH